MINSYKLVCFHYPLPSPHYDSQFFSSLFFCYFKLRHWYRTNYPELLDSDRNLKRRRCSQWHSFSRITPPTLVTQWKQAFYQPLELGICNSIPFHNLVRNPQINPSSKLPFYRFRVLFEEIIVHFIGFIVKFIYKLIVGHIQELWNWKVELLGDQPFGSSWLEIS